MGNKGYTTIELTIWLIGALGAVAAYTHATFVTYREVAPRLDRIENKLDAVLSK